jgi:glycoside/pentoside/hexuronide:cation symporter, GPH family
MTVNDGRVGDVAARKGGALSQPASAAARTPLSTILVFAAGGLPLSAVGIAMQIYVQPYFTRDLGVGLVTMAFAFTMVRFLDMGVDPVLAVFMDRTKTPLGRYRLWLVAGAPVLMLAVYQLFMAPRGIGANYLILWLLVYAFGSSLALLSRAAWAANLVTRYDQRSRFYGYLTAIVALGNFIILSIPIVSKHVGSGVHNDVHLMGWTILALIPLGFGLNAWLVPERVNVDAPTHHFSLRDYWGLATKPEVVRLFISAFALTLGPGWMANLYLFFFSDARGFDTAQSSVLLSAYIGAGILGAPFVGIIGARFSKHRTLMAATVCYSLGLCTVNIVPRANLLATLPVMMWCGFMAVGFELMTSAMMADVGDQVRLEQGKERMALLFAVTGLAGKLAAAGSLAISYPLLALVGYVPKLGLHNTPAAISGLTLVFIIGPIFWVVLGGVCFIGWKLDARKHADIRAQLETRDALLAEAALGGLNPLT